MACSYFGAGGSDLRWPVIAGYLGLAKIAGGRSKLLVLATNAQ